MKNNSSERRFRLSEPTFFLLFAAVTAFLLWKCRYGMACFDEPFYLAVPYRLTQGDALFVHEWHLSQMASVLLYPAVSAYLAVTGSADGIVLAFRYLYTAVQAAASLFFYFRLKRIHPVGAAAASIGFLIHAPFGVMALSYNTMGILNLSMAVVIYLTAENYKPFQYAVSGLFLAGAVLCCPYLLLVYGYLLAAALVFRFRRRDNALLKCWGWVTVGAAAAAVAFVFFELSRVPLDRILAAFPEMFRDPEHQGRSFLSVVVTYLYYFVRGTGPVSLIVGAGWVAAYFVALRDRTREHIARSFAIGAALMVAFSIPFATSRSYPNYLMYPMNLFAVYCLGLTKAPRCREIFWKVVVPGLIYSFCIHWSSNQHFIVMTAAMSVSFLGSMMIVVLTAEEILAKHPIQPLGKTNLVSAALCVLLLFQLGAELEVRYRTVFWEAGMPKLTHRIEHGPERGLLASESAGTYYDQYYELITSDPRYQQADSVLFLTMDTWMYLMDNKEISAYSAWLSGVNETTAERLQAYYRLNPDKLPDFVFTFRDNAEVAEAVFDGLDYVSDAAENYLILSR